MLGARINVGIEIPGEFSMTSSLKSERMVWRVSQAASILVHVKCATSVDTQDIENHPNSFGIKSLDKTTAVATWCNLWKKSELNTQ